ncbi:unnamed protein product [Cylicocyclus nassatus]|uniref:HD/PDEase domain-containing protein n=1 Tax=Cylicocyclus nassatus TaxID=53992 RepID=A0AA36H9B5_CYLNA|nr:unnamed protein product [Cylicocyclus nassatus]
MQMIEKKIVPEWPPLFKKREIQDMVHGPISLFHPLDQVVDTREFQRLRELKQQGVSYFVYPCSTHSRFVHSLGTYWLAYKFVESLKRDTFLKINSQDHLCVCMAALCHDLGHGPFSHVFDGAFRHASGTATQSEFSDSDGNWLPQGRPVEKAFLYDIVSNSSDSIDVDKFDYLVRDSFHAGIPIPFNKVADILLSVGDSRQMMHNLVYRHRVVCAIETLVVKAMILSDEHIKYMGDDGKEYNLSKVTQNLEAYLKTTDAVLREIANSSNPEISEARKILEDIHRRNIPVMIAEVECGPSRAESGSALQNRISQSLREELDAFYDEKNIMVLVREMNRGLDGRTHPMTRILLYDNKVNDRIAQPVSDEWLRLKAPQEAAVWSICLYGSRSMINEERSIAVNAFDAVVARFGLRAPELEMTAVDRGYCPNECMGRGICLEVDGQFRCLCDEELDNCEGSPAKLVFDPGYWVPVGSIVVLLIFGLVTNLLIHCALVRRRRRPTSSPELTTHIPLHSSALTLPLGPEFEDIPL